MAPANSALSKKKKRRPPEAGPQHRATQAPMPQTACTKRKRSRDAEAEAEADELKKDRPAKQPRKSTPPRLKLLEEQLPKDSKAEAKTDGLEGPSERPQEPPLLSEKDSQSLQSLYQKVMDSTSSKSLKRTLSRHSIAPSDTGSDRTQRSSNNHAVYRRQNLAAVKIRLHAELPDQIETTVRDIVNAKCLEPRRAELDVVAQKFRHGCLKNVRAQSGEDDFIDPLHTAIKALRFKDICIHKKAAWRSELKPIIRQQSHFSSSFMAGIQHAEVDGASAPLSKRQQQQHTNEYMSPESSMANATTPSANHAKEPGTKPPPILIPEKEDRSSVKTPHPDLSIGIDLDALISALSPDLDEDKATEFIDWLQEEMVQHEPDAPLEPMLILVPAPRALDLAFPFMVVEGKAYSTGKQIFEAENQAAVSMAYALNILHSLDRMAHRGKIANTQPRVLFSITTQGPLHELWVHWTVVKGGVRIYESKLWDSWNGLVQERANEFMVKLHNVCVWGTESFMTSMVEGLRKVAVQARLGYEGNGWRIEQSSFYADPSSLRGHASVDDVPWYFKRRARACPARDSVVTGHVRTRTKTSSSWVTTFRKPSAKSTSPLPQSLHHSSPRQPSS